MIAKFIKKNWYFILEVFILFGISFIPLLWFRPSHVFLGLDSGYPIDFIGYMHQRFYTWLSSQNTGVDTVSWLGQIPFIASLGILQQLGVGLYNVQKIVFIFWFFVMSFSMYLLVGYLYPQKQLWLLRLSAVFIYVFNFYLLSFWIQGEQSTFSAFTLLPIVVLLLIRFIRNECGILLSSILLNIAFLLFNAGGIFGVPLLGSTIASILAIILFSFATFKKDQWFILLKKFLILGLISGVLIIILNAYYIIPFISVFSHQYATTVGTRGGYDAIVSWAAFISKLASFSNLSRLQGDVNWDNHLNFYGYDFQTNPALIILSFAFPILAFSSYFLIKNKKEKWIILLLLTIGAFGFFFAGGLHAPFGFIYEFLMKHLPGFIAFRSPYYKFVAMIYLSFAILAGISINSLVMKIKKIQYNFIIGIGILLLILLYHYPYFDSASFVFESPFTAIIKVPGYVLDFQKEELERKDESRTLILPPVNNFPIFAYSWNYWSTQSPFVGLTEKPFVSNDSGLNQEESDLVNLLYEKLRERKFDEFKQIAKILDIKRIILTEDIVRDYPRAPTEDPKEFKKILDDNFFHSVWEKGSWSIYAWDDSQVDKIAVTNSLFLRKGNSYNIFSSKTENKSFINNDQIPAFLINSLPINSMVTSYPCISCVLSKIDEIKIPQSSVLPSSRFYQFKLWRDEQALRKGKGDLGIYLGLSLKRTSEMISLKDLNAWSFTIDSWTSTNQLLLEYWRKINSIMNKTQDFANYSLVRQYALIEDNSLSDVYESLPSSSFKSTFGKTVLYIKNIRENLDERFQKEIEGARLTYDVDPQKEYRIRFSSLIDNNTNSALASFQLNNNIISPITNSGEFILQNDSLNGGRLTISLNNPNLLTSLASDTFDMPDKKINCIYGPITSFQWNNSYVISTNFTKMSGIDYIYLIRFSNLNDEDTFLASRNKSFIPRESFNLSNKSSNKIIFNFTGLNDDKGIVVLFCVNNYSDPKQFYSNPAVSAINAPVIYSSNQIETKTNELPKILYAKINPTEYLVTVKNAKNSYVLSFLERFSSQWKAQYVDEKKNINDSSHFILNAYANGWHVDRKGSYVIRIYFAPQNTFIVGTGISIISISVICVYLLIKLWRKHI